MTSTDEEAPRPSRVAVLGMGGVGGLVAALLIKAGHRVTAVASPQTCEVLGSRGLTVRSDHVFGTVAVDQVACTSELAEPVEILFVAVKSTGLDSALDRIPAAVLESALVVPLLNGIEHVDVLRARYPDVAVTAAAICVEAAKVEAGVIEHRSPFARVELAPGDDPARTRHCAGVLRGAGLETSSGAGEAEVLWKKLVFLAPLALLTTHFRAPAGVIRADHRDELIALTEEVAAVAEREQVALHVADALAFFGGVPDGMRSSMQNDAEAGRPIELEAIGGAILRRARRYGVDVPVTSRYVERLRARG